MSKANNQTGDELVLSRTQVRACDRVAIEDFEINGLVLMENAGSAAARHILSLLDPLPNAGVCVIAGTGNNAGDGFVVARHLTNAGVNIKVLVCGARDRVGGDALSNLRIIEHMGLPITYADQQPPDALAVTIRSHVGPTDLIVDAMLGTGTAGPPREPIRSAIEEINRLTNPVVALDIPSGLDCDTGQPLEIAVKADHTVTFAAIKKGFHSPAAAAYTGRLTVAGIGIRTDLLCRQP